ncbi:MAG: UDP-N-acetylmuramate dehydrogenase [Gammaproteobacteria bacterium]
MMAESTQQLRGVMKYDEPMSRHTSWRVGGKARQFYQPDDIADLSLFLSQIPEGEQVFWVGLGSNLLVRDGGLDGTVICTSGVMNQIIFMENNQVRVEAGVACPKVARMCAREGLTGSEFLCGIPGTMGGALAMNAGCLGSETWDLVVQVETIDRKGNLHRRTPDEFEIAYRHVRGKEDEWFVACMLQLEAGDKEEANKTIKSYLARRSATQPTQQPNAGSVFRNPQGDYAARLIESAGLKNTCIGGACVSEKHANFIINSGTATAADIEALIAKVKSTVLQVHNIELIHEVHIVGEEAVNQ